MTRHGPLDLLRAPLPRRAGDILPRDLGEHVALDPARRNRIHRDAPLAEILGEALGDAVDGRLAAGIERVVADWDEPRGDGRHEDQAAALLAVFVGVLADEELRPEVEPEDEIEPLLRHVLDLVETLHPAVRADDVDLAEVGFGLVEEAGDFGDLGDVGLDGVRGGAGGFDLRDDGLRAGEAFDVVDDDGGAAAAELEGDAGADAAGSAGDERDFAGEGAEGVGGEGGGGMAVCGGWRVGGGRDGMAVCGGWRVGGGRGVVAVCGGFGRRGAVGGGGGHVFGCGDRGVVCGGGRLGWGCCWFRGWRLGVRDLLVGDGIHSINASQKWKGDNICIWDSRSMYEWIKEKGEICSI